MEHIFSALVPVFGLILIGYLFKRISFPSHEFWPMADKLTYFILMPALLIYKLSNAKFEANSVSFVLASLIAIFLTMIILIIVNKITPTKNSSFTSIVQGGIRFNTYVFLAISGSIFGDTGLVLFSVLPTAPSSFILARQLGGDISLITSIITVQTLASAFFIIIFLKMFI